MHTDRCPGFDGWINIKYTCVNHKKLVQYCNIDLSGSSGYVTNPGYPKFYPPYVCKWKINAFPGQRIQIEILDLAIKEPRLTKTKLLGYDCTDQLAIIEENAKVVQLCGDVKSNLIEYRSKSDHLVIEFVSFDFSPSRGVLFKYSRKLAEMCEILHNARLNKLTSVIIIPSAELSYTESALQWVHDSKWLTGLLLVRPGSGL